MHSTARSRLRKNIKSALRAARRRLDWRYDITRHGLDAQRGTVARTLALLFGTGAILLLFTLLLPQAGPEDRNEPVLLAVAGVGFLVAAALLISFARTPMWLLTVVPAAGTVLVGVVISSAGSDAATSYALYFAWVVVAAATFLGRAATAAHGAFAVAVYDIGTRVSGPDAVPSPLALAMLAGSAAAIGVVIAGLSAQVRRFVAELESDARTDPLTGLDNRRALREGFAQELGRSDRTRRPLALILLDLDRFKRYNDSHGHPAGDDALRRLARILNRVTRTTELAARTGGEEFAIVAPETDSAGAVVLAERVRTAVETEFADDRPGLTVSLGIAVREPGGLGFRDLFASADRALYAAKELGRNRVELATPPTRRFHVDQPVDDELAVVSS